MVERIPVDSASVRWVGHDGANNELHVEFTGGDRYVYAMVPASVFAELLAAESVGRFVNQRIKPRYPVRPR